MRLLPAPAWDAAVELCNTRRVGVDRGRRGTGISSTLKASRPGREHSRVDVEPGASALDRTLSAPRGVARCETAAAESDGGLLADTRNST